LAKEDVALAWTEIRGKIAIEMKSRGKDLGKAYAQLKDYVVHLEPNEMPPLLMVSDFEQIHVYHRTSGKSKKFRTNDLSKNIKQFAAIAGYEAVREYDPQIEFRDSSFESSPQKINVFEIFKLLSRNTNVRVI
jgi:hypothetical protein